MVVHAASNPRRRAKETEIEGARQVAAAARDAGAHVLYVCIVGVDRHRYGYYRAKHAAERPSPTSGARWTIPRATQFHDLLHRALGSGWFVRTPDLRFQPVDVAGVARRSAQIAPGPRSGTRPTSAAG